MAKHHRRPEKTPAPVREPHGLSSKDSLSDDVEERLEAIFRDDKGEVPDLTRFERHTRSRLLMAGIGLASFILVLTIAAWAGFWVFKPFRGFQGQGLRIEVDGPQRVALGEETTYFVNWQNDSSGPLASADIRVNFPTDFSLVSAEPAPTEPGLFWRIGSVPFGGRGTIVVKGAFTGALGTQTAIQVVGTYRPASFNSDFEAVATRKLEYADTVLDGVIEAPEKSLPGDKVRIVYKLQNRGTAPMKGLEARIVIPEGFVRDATSTGGELDGRTVRFHVGDLAAGATTTVSVTGSFASGVSGDVAVHAETGRIGADGSFQPAQKADGTIAVLAGDLSLKLVVNGSDADRSVGFGDLLRLTIGYENTATEDLKNVAIRLKLEPLMATTTAKKPESPAYLDWASLEDSSSGTVSGNVLSWTKSQIGVLERLPPRQDGSIDFSVPVVLTAPSGTSALGFTLVAEATMEAVGKTVVNRMIRTAPMTFRLRSDASLAVEARYFSEEGAPLGSGPLPPVVGETTAYRISWTIQKTLHELKGIRVTASLPKQVGWPAKTTVTAGDVSYDASSRTVTWMLNRMPKDVEEARAEFDVQLTPSEFDAGRFADLLGETRFEATDADINDVIVRTKPPLSTDLQNDEGAKSKGVVRKP